MASISSLTNIWENIKEADLRPLRDEALHGVRISLVGAPGSGRRTLAEAMRRDPSHPEQALHTPLLILDLEAARQADSAELIILVVDSRNTDIAAQQELVKGWSNASKKVLIFINQFEESQGSMAVSPWTSGGKRRVAWGSALDERFLVERFAPQVIEMLPERLLALGRFFPLFRLPIAQRLVNDTCFSNAAYALTTGLAQVIPIADIPLALADMVVLTKAQLFLVYKLGLAFGFSTQWKDYIAEFGSVLGSGFIWRQIARLLIGLIPVWGILPKTAVAYAGTYVVGNVVLQWHLNGRRLNRQQMSQLYAQARARGKRIAESLYRSLPHMPRLRLPRIHTPRLPRLPHVSLPRRKPKALPAPHRPQVCTNCGKTNSADASFCQYCGKPIQLVLPEVGENT
jgi:uncharacterized protein (DUF697 family)